MKKILLLLVPAALLLVSCNLFNDFGKKVKINDKLSVYYKGNGVTESDAKKLGEFIEKNRGDNKEDLAAQITKENEFYVMRMPVNEDMLNKNRESLVNLFWFMQDLVAEDVFSGKKTKIILTDNKLKDKITLDELNKIATGKGHFLYLKGNSVQLNEGKKIADSLEAANFFNYTAGAIMLTKEKGSYAMRFLPNETKQNDTSTDYNIVLENYKYIISKYILDNSAVDLYIIDDSFREVKKIKDPTDDRKVQIDQLMKAEQNDTVDSQ